MSTFWTELSEMKMMKILSLFDGISCGMLALQRAGIPVDEYHAFEIDKYALAVSKKNYPEIIQHGDVFDGEYKQFKGFDILMGGSPCTYWSVAKKYRETTTEGEGFRLFMEYIRALNESNCKYFLYENNYSIHKNISAEISVQLGVEPIMIDSALLSAQSRKRYYWTNIPNVHQPADKHIVVSDILEKGVIPRNDYKEKVRTIKAQYGKTSLANAVRDNDFGATMAAKPIRVGQINGGGQGQRVYSIHGKTVTMSANGGGQGAKTGLYKVDLPDGDYTIRKLTPIEAERAQTLPDNYTEGISNTQRYKCIGNAWTVDVIAHILGGLAA